MSGFTLHLGDCLQVLRTLPDNSVDAIVTDPPYHLTAGKQGGSGPASESKGEKSPFATVSRMNSAGFMGMQWDGGDIAFRPELWAEALRVLKPGGHLLAFSGSRTYHRMACAIEDGGFEIRDQLQWIFGSGMPKSLNLDNLRGVKICGCMVRSSHHEAPRPNTRTEESATDGAAGKKSQAEHGLRPVLDADLSQGIDPGAKCGEVLQSSLPESGASTAGRAQLWAAENGDSESSLEGRGDAAIPPRELREGALCSGDTGAAEDGKSGRLCDGASSGNGDLVRLPADANGGGASCEPRAVEQRSQESGTLAGQRKPQAVGAWPICGRCELPMVPEGLGTALKPAHEPICMARKPLTGTVAANVLAHGTGALNIDACRVPVDDAAYARNCSGDRGHDNNRSRNMEFGMTAGSAHTLGRWPANVLHDGSEEVVGLFPAQAGAAAPVHTRNADKFRNSYGKFAGNVDEAGSTFHGDKGSAARFFYCAKASRADRNEGCEQLDRKPLLWSAGTQNPGSFQSGGTDKSSQNNHPTVKPTELMRWLVRLVTPAGGIVLDPFMGSGSTGKACMREGFGFIGIEQNPDYLAIARTRIEHAQQQAELANTPPEPSPQLGLFGDAA